VRAAELLTGLVVDARRMRANLGSAAAFTDAALAAHREADARLSGMAGVRHCQGL
jgi:hypothetical protein